MNKNKSFAIAAVIGALVLVLMLSWGMQMPLAHAAPSAAPTPVAGVVDTPGTAQNAVWMSNLVVTADTGSRALNLGNYAKADVQVVLDKTGFQTTTLKLQFSNDQTNWTDGATIGSALTADTSTLAQYALFGRYARVYADVTNSNPVTITVLGLAK
jgi:hypothetical protein